MDTLVFSLAVMCSIGLGGVALSFAAILQTSSSTRTLEQRSKARKAEMEAALEGAKEAVASLETKVHQIQERTSTSPPPAIPRAAFNICTRSLALRMHRRGESPSQIAAALQVPVQEVELLLRVHQIVLDNFIVTTKPERELERAQTA